MRLRASGHHPPICDELRTIISLAMVFGSILIVAEPGPPPPSGGFWRLLCSMVVSPLSPPPSLLPRSSETTGLEPTLSLSPSLGSGGLGYHKKMDPQRSGSEDIFPPPFYPPTSPSSSPSLPPLPALPPLVDANNDLNDRFFSIPRFRRFAKAH